MENPSERENRLGNLTKSLKSLSRTLEIEEIYLFQYQMLPPPPRLSPLSTTMFLTYFYLLNYLPLCSNTIDYESLSFAPKPQNGGSVTSKYSFNTITAFFI